MHVLYKLI